MSAVNRFNDVPFTADLILGAGGVGVIDFGSNPCNTITIASDAATDTATLPSDDGASAPALPTPGVTPVTATTRAHRRKLSADGTQKVISQRTPRRFWSVRSSAAATITVEGGISQT